MSELIITLNAVRTWSDSDISNREAETFLVVAAETLDSARKTLRLLRKARDE